MPEELYAFKPVSFARIAREMGCFAVRVEDPNEIKDAIQNAMDAEMPAVVEVVTGIQYRAPVPWTPAG